MASPATRRRGKAGARGRLPGSRAAARPRRARPRATRKEDARAALRGGARTGRGHVGVWTAPSQAEGRSFLLMFWAEWYPTNCQLLLKGHWLQICCGNNLSSNRPAVSNVVELGLLQSRVVGSGDAQGLWVVVFSEEKGNKSNRCSKGILHQVYKTLLSQK